MTEITRDPIFGTEVSLLPGERLITTFRADPSAYWRANGILAVLAGIVAAAALTFIGNPTPWVGPVAAVLAIALRAFYLKSEVMAEEWRLTDRRLLGPAGRIAPLSSLTQARHFLGAVQLVMAGGDKHLIKYQADAAATVAAIEAAKAGKS
jgi:hypothetical protein